MRKFLSIIKSDFWHILCIGEFLRAAVPSSTGEDYHAAFHQEPNKRVEDVHEISISTAPQEPTEFSMLTNSTRKGDKTTVGEIVGQAFNDAMKLLSPLGVDQDLKKANLCSMAQVSDHIRNRLNRSARTVDIALPTPIDEHLYQVDSNSDDTSTDEDDDDRSGDFDSNEEDEEDDDDDVVNLHVDNGARAEGHGDEDMSSRSTTNSSLMTMKGPGQSSVIGFCGSQRKTRDFRVPNSVNFPLSKNDVILYFQSKTHSRTYVRIDKRKR